MIIVALDCGLGNHERQRVPVMESAHRLDETLDATVVRDVNGDPVLAYQVARRELGVVVQAENVWHDRAVLQPLHRLRRYAVALEPDRHLVAGVDAPEQQICGQRRAAAPMLNIAVE